MNRGNVLMVPYASLVSDFENSVRSVCRFCDVDYKDAFGGVSFGDVEAREHHKNVLRPVTTDSIGKGRVELEKDAIARIEEQTSELYTKLISNKKCEVLR